MTECGGGLTAVAVDGDDEPDPLLPRARTAGTWRRPASSTSLASTSPAHAPRRRRGGRRAAPRAGLPDAGPTTLILAGEQLGVQLHESVGHAVELDRVLGREASYAGSSYVARPTRSARCASAPSS